MSPVYKSHDKTCLKTEKNWSLLIHWVTKKTSKINEKVQKQSSGGVL